MPLSPKMTEEKINEISSAWKNLAADKTFAGMTLDQFKKLIKPSTDARATLQDLENQVSAAQNAREDADVETNRLIALVVNSVKGDVQFGEDSPLYEAMGYVRKSDRKSGLSRGKKVKPTPP